MPFFEPSRPGLASLQAMVADAGSGDVAWQRLVDRGALPATWLDDPQRRFVHDPESTRDPAYRPRGPHPYRADDCALIAADVPGVLAAEAAARVLAERLAPWGAPPFRFALWWFRPLPSYRYATQDTRPGVNYALMFAHIALCRSMPREAGPERLFGEARHCSELWRAQAAAGATVRADERIPGGRVAGVAFAALPDPYEPLAAIEDCGYAGLEWIGATGAAYGAVMLVCPADR